MKNGEEINGIITEAERFFSNLKEKFYRDVGDDIGRKIDSVGDKVNSINIKLASIETKLERVDKIETRVDRIDERVGTVERAVGKLETTARYGEQNDTVFSDRSWAIIMVVLSVVITGVITYHSFAQ